MDTTRPSEGPTQQHQAAAACCHCPTKLPLRCLSNLRERQAVNRQVSFGAAAIRAFECEIVANGPTIHAVISLDSAPDDAKLIAFLERVCSMSERFSSIILPNKKSGVDEWTLVDDFTVDEVVHTITLPGNDCQTELNGLIMEKLTKLFPPSMPYWEVYSIKYEAADKHELLIRISHAVADGVTLASVLINCTEYADDEPAEIRMPGNSWANLAAFDEAAKQKKQAHHQAPTYLQATTNWLWKWYVRVAEASNVLSLLAQPRDPESPIYPKKSTEDRAIAWTDLDISTIKQASKTAGITINDVIHAAMSSAMRKYMSDKGPVPKSVRGFCIFNVRRLKGLRPNGFCTGARFGNDFAYAIAPINLSETKPVALLYKSKAVMDRLKASAQPYIVHALNLTLHKFLPFSLVFKIVNLILGKGTFMFTNLAGPSMPVTLAGARVARIYNHVNLPSSLPLLISFLSYNGRLNVGVTADKGIIPDPEAIASYFKDSMNEICGAVTVNKEE